MNMRTQVRIIAVKSYFKGDTFEQAMEDAVNAKIEMMAAKDWHQRGISVPFGPNNNCVMLTFEKTEEKET